MTTHQLLTLTSFTTDLLTQKHSTFAVLFFSVSSFITSCFTEKKGAFFGLFLNQKPNLISNSGEKSRSLKAYTHIS